MTADEKTLNEAGWLALELIELCRQHGFTIHDAILEAKHVEAERVGMERALAMLERDFGPARIRQGGRWG